MLAQVLRIQKSMQAAIYSPASSVDRAAAQAAKKAIRTYVQPSIVTDFGIVNNCIGLIGFSLIQIYWLASSSMSLWMSRAVSREPSRWKSLRVSLRKSQGLGLSLGARRVCQGMKDPFALPVLNYSEVDIAPALFDLLPAINRNIYIASLGRPKRLIYS